jgi:serine/threonine protein phosphatase PrpC
MIRNKSSSGVGVVDESNKNLYPKNTDNQDKTQSKINLNNNNTKINNNNRRSKKEEENIKTPVIKKIRKIHQFTHVGFNGVKDKDFNQDIAFIEKNFAGDNSYIYFGVCDGHGDYGKDISTFLVTNLPLVLGNFLRIFNIKDLSSIEGSTLLQISKNSFIQVNKNLFLENEIDSTLSGSTCVSLIYTPKKIFCINVGDSQCIVGRFNGKNWESKDLSMPHKPDDKKEKERKSR